MATTPAQATAPRARLLKVRTTPVLVRVCGHVQWIAEEEDAAMLELHRLLNDLRAARARAKDAVRRRRSPSGSIGMSISAEDVRLHDRHQNDQPGKRVLATHEMSAVTKLTPRPHSF